METFSGEEVIGLLVAAFIVGMVAGVSVSVLAAWLNTPTKDELRHRERAP